MYLSNIKLWNFRKYWPSTFPFTDKPNLDLNFSLWLNLLIWANDSWKTAILDAIKLVLKTNTWEWIKVDKEEDFHKWTNNIKIQLRFDNFKTDEARHFAEFLCVDTTIPTNPKEYLILNCEISKNTDRVFPFDIKAWPNWDIWILTAEQRDYLNVTYLKPLRDVKTEFIPKKWSRLSTILESHEAFKWKWNTHLLMWHFEDFNKSIENYFKWLEKDWRTSLSDQKWDELKKKIDEFIQEFLDSEDEWNFWVNSWELKNILEKLELTLKDNINPWLWSLNRLFIASELLHLQRDYDGLELWLIEEIEAHIHPQAQMKVIESLQNRINNTKTQLIITTHSPNLASKVKLENLIICDWWNAFPMWESYTELKKEDYRFLERFLDVTKSNLFFSKWVILVEWWAEEIILPTFARLLKVLWVIEKDLTQAEVSIVNVWSDTFFRYANIFKRQQEPFMDKRVAIVTDIDLKPECYKINVNTEWKTPDEQKAIWKSINIISEYSVTEITEERNKKSINEQSIKTFLTDDDKWTLEYSLWLFSKFQELLFKAILYAFKEKQNYHQTWKIEDLRKNMEEDFETNFSWLWNNDIDISFSIYNQLLWNQKVVGMAKVELSKTIVAQYFAEFLEDEINKIENWQTSIFEKSDFENISSISYLVNAIKHATNQ